MSSSLYCSSISSACSDQINELVDIYLNYFGIIDSTLLFNQRLNQKIKQSEEMVIASSASNVSQRQNQDDCESSNENYYNNGEWINNTCIINANTSTELSSADFQLIEFKENYCNNVHIYKNNRNKENGKEIFINQYPDKFKFNIQYIIQIPEDLAAFKFIFVYEYDNIYYITFPTGHIESIPNEQIYYNIKTRNDILRLLFKDDKEKYVFCGHSEGCVMSQHYLMQYGHNDEDIWTADIIQKCYSVGSAMFQNAFTRQQLQVFHENYKNKHLYLILFYYDSYATARDKGIEIDPYFLRQDNVNNIVIRNLAQLSSSSSLNLRRFSNILFINNLYQTIDEAINMTTSLDHDNLLKTPTNIQKSNTIFNSIKVSLNQMITPIIPIKTELGATMHDFSRYAAFFNRISHQRKDFLLSHLKIIK